MRKLLEGVADEIGRVTTDVETILEAGEDTPEQTCERKQGLDFVLWKFWQQFPHIERDFEFILNCFLQ